jgi:ABC-2 type transport system ATP-binding protein
MIEVSGLTKVYPSGCRAIDGLSLSIEQGEIFALLGPNGAGKTSTIRVLSTLAGFDDGSVVVAGHNVDTDPDKVRGAIGFVGQQTGVDYLLTGRENLMLHGQLYRIENSTLKKRVDELSSYFNLGDSLDSTVMTYSGGMRRKLDIAASLIHKPQVLFLDEPTLGLDIHSRQSLWQLIEKLNRELKLTILLTTHYLEEADKLARRVGIINAGKIQVIGTPEELKDKIRGDAVVLVFETVNQAAKAFANDMAGQPFIQDTVWEQDKLHLYLDNAPNNIAKIMHVADEHRMQVKTLSLARPTLDDVFIKYTGTSLEGGESETTEEWWSQWAGKGSWGQGKQWGKWAGADQQDAEQEQSPPDQQVGQLSSGNQWSDKQWPDRGKGDAEPQKDAAWQDRKQDEKTWNQGQWGKDKWDKDKTEK